MRAKGDGKVVLVTGAGRRIGAAIVRFLLSQNHRIVLHVNTSEAEGREQCASLSQTFPDSLTLVQADLSQSEGVAKLAREAQACWDCLDCIVNNASLFFPTPLEEATEAQWEALFSVNVKAPYFLVQQCREALQAAGGSVVNLIDIHGERPLSGYSVYSQSKAALLMQTKSLAKELAPHVRVNGVSPGAILWPEDMNAATQAHIVKKIPLRRVGSPEDVAKAVNFFINDAPYVTGQVLNVDGGRSL